MTQKVTVTLAFSLTEFTTLKSHGVIRSHRDLLWQRWPLWSVWSSSCPQNVTGSLMVAVTYLLTPKVTVTYVVGLTWFMTQMSWSNYRSPWPTLWPRRSIWPLALTLTYDMTQKGYWVESGRDDLLYDPKCHGDTCGKFDLVYDPKKSRGH